MRQTWITVGILEPIAKKGGVNIFVSIEEGILAEWIFLVFLLDFAEGGRKKDLKMGLWD